MLNIGKRLPTSGYHEDLAPGPAAFPVAETDYTGVELGIVASDLHLGGDALIVNTPRGDYPQMHGRSGSRDDDEFEINVVDVSDAEDNGGSDGDAATIIGDCQMSSPTPDSGLRSGSHNTHDLSFGDSECGLADRKALSINSSKFAGREVVTDCGRGAIVTNELTSSTATCSRASGVYEQQTSEQSHALDLSFPQPNAEFTSQVATGSSLVVSKRESCAQQGREPQRANSSADVPSGKVWRLYDDARPVESDEPNDQFASNPDMHKSPETDDIVNTASVNMEVETNNDSSSVSAVGLSGCDYVNSTDATREFNQLAETSVPKHAPGNHEDVTKRDGTRQFDVASLLFSQPFTPHSSFAASNPGAPVSNEMLLLQQQEQARFRHLLASSDLPAFGVIPPTVPPAELLLPRVSDSGESLANFLQLQQYFSNNFLNPQQLIPAQVEQFLMLQKSLQQADPSVMARTAAVATLLAMQARDPVGFAQAPLLNAGGGGLSPILNSFLNHNENNLNNNNNSTENSCIKDVERLPKNDIVSSGESAGSMFPASSQPLSLHLATSEGDSFSSKSPSAFSRTLLSPRTCNAGGKRAFVRNGVHSRSLDLRRKNSGSGVGGSVFSVYKPGGATRSSPGPGHDRVGFGLTFNSQPGHIDNLGLSSTSFGSSTATTPYHNLDSFGDQPPPLFQRSTLKRSSLSPSASFRYSAVRHHSPLSSTSSLSPMMNSGKVIGGPDGVGGGADPNTNPQLCSPCPPGSDRLDSKLEQLASLAVGSMSVDVPVSGGSTMTATGEHGKAGVDPSVSQRPSVIKGHNDLTEPDPALEVDEHFRRSFKEKSVVSSQDANVDDHFARALGETWWKLKRMHSNAAD